MAAVETCIWMALKSRIETLPMGYAIAWPSKPFTPPSVGGKLQPFFRVGRVNAAPRGVFVEYDKPHDRNGFLVVTLVYPLGQDISVYDELAGKVANHFKSGTQVKYDNVCVTVNNQPYVQDGYEDNAYWNVPVSIPWRCFA